jgi:hypothetical protein
VRDTCRIRKDGPPVRGGGREERKDERIVRKRWRNNTVRKD